MQSVLNKTVSCAKRYNSPAAELFDVNLLTWLTSEKYRVKVEYLRGCTDTDEIKALKASLPIVLVSGKFFERNSAGLIQHSGLICIDIDRKDNPNISNWDEIPAALAGMANVAYAGLSVSGKGYFAIIPIAYPEKHKQQFYALERDFLSVGIVIDPVCHELNRARGYSYDPAPYFNHNATPYRKTFDKDAAQRTQYSYSGTLPTWATGAPDAVSMLQAHGWTVVKETPSKVYVLRPGHSTAKHSGNVLKSTGQFYCWTGSTSLEPGCYSPFRLYTELYHRGNKQEAREALNRQQSKQNSVY